MPRKSKQELEDEKLSPKEFYDKEVANIKERIRNGEMVKCSEFDPVREWAKDRRCLTCGRLPDKHFITPYECERCAINRLGEDKYNEFMKRKSASEIKYNDPKRLERFGIKQEEDDDLPF